ncbi:MAG: hypothetical protein LBB49_03460 [Gracilibacteraceae bacterium]|nr:hypothetical protein [Gracilibacteraceae bacterium]
MKLVLKFYFHRLGIPCSLIIPLLVFAVFGCVLRLFFCPWLKVHTGWTDVMKNLFSALIGTIALVISVFNIYIKPANEQIQKKLCIGLKLTRKYSAHYSLYTLSCIWLGYVFFLAIALNFIFYIYPVDSYLALTIFVGFLFVLLLWFLGAGAASNYNDCKEYVVDVYAEEIPAILQNEDDQGEHDLSLFSQYAGEYSADQKYESLEFAAFLLHLTLLKGLQGFDSGKGRRRVPKPAIPAYILYKLVKRMIGYMIDRPLYDKTRKTRILIVVKDCLAAEIVREDADALPADRLKEYLVIYAAIASHLLVPRTIIIDEEAFSEHVSDYLDCRNRDSYPYSVSCDDKRDFLRYYDQLLLLRIKQSRSQYPLAVASVPTPEDEVLKEILAEVSSIWLEDDLSFRFVKSYKNIQLEGI